MTPQEKEIKTTELLKGLEATKLLMKGDDWQIIFQPQIFAVIVSLLQQIFSLFGGKSKGMFDSVNFKLDTLLAALNGQTDVQKKILTHLETTCLQKADIEKIMGAFSDSVAECVAAKIPGELMRMEIAPAAMKFQRKSE